MMGKEQISEAEWKVMEILWMDSPLLAKEINERLKYMNWTFATVKTLLNRLVKKNIISYEKNGKTFNYFPVFSKEECIKNESKRFIDKIFKGSNQAFLTSFVKETKLTKEEINELKKILESKGKSNGDN